MEGFLSLCYNVGLKNMVRKKDRNMTFSSVTFLFLFLPITFVLYALIRNHTARNIILAASSLIFYAYGEPVAVMIMLISIVLNYLFGRLASGNKLDKAAVAAAVILNIGLLFVYKYTGFFAEIFNAVFHAHIPVPHIRLPIGISFFTFQGLSYVIDVYRSKEKVQKSLFSVLLYIAFFPQLIAGPIVRYEDIADRLDQREFSVDRISRGLHRFILKKKKKVLIANQMGLIADHVFGLDPALLGTAGSWVGAICYTLQIFFDFSGYSDMAIGLGCVFGFDFKENFNYPFIASSIQTFWRRWHISLSTWFKEYVYIPLGGNRKGKARTTLNKLIVFFLTGLWHGANFTFIIWGLLHGLCQMLETWHVIPVEKKWFKPFGHLYTLLVVVVAFVLFRADTLGQGFALIGRMFDFSALRTPQEAEVFALITPLFLVTFIIAILISMPVFPKLREKALASSLAVPYEYAASLGTLVIFALCVLSLVSSKYNPFIYFRF